VNKLNIPMLKNITQMDKPLIGSFFKPVNFDQQPGPMMPVAVDKLNVCIRFLKLFVVSLRPTAILNGFCSGKNGIKILPVKC